MMTIVSEMADLMEEHKVHLIDEFSTKQGNCSQRSQDSSLPDGNLKEEKILIDNFFDDFEENAGRLRERHDPKSEQHTRETSEKHTCETSEQHTGETSEQHTRETSEQHTRETSEQHSREANGDSWYLKPPDGGYGWFVVLGCFISHVIFGGLDRSEGVIFLLLKEEFGKSSSLTSWPGAIVSTLQLVLGPMANVICTRYSVRSTVLVGGAFMFLGLFLNGLASSFYFLFFTHAIIGGIGRGLAYAPGLIIVGMYFEKKAGLATGLGTSGVGFGTFLMVPLVQYLSDNFGFQGTFLIISGLASNMFLAAMLYRPASMHSRFMKTNKSCFKPQTQPLENSNCNDEESVKLEPIARYQDSSMERQCEPYQKREINKVSTKPGEKAKKVFSFIKICFPIENKEKSSKPLRKLFQLGLLRNHSFLLYCLSIGVFAMSTRAAFTFIPALIETKGILKSEAAIALSVTGALDTVGRILIGFILDLPKLQPHRPILYNIPTFGVAVVALALPFQRSLVAFCILCGLYGFFSGAYISQKSIVLLSILEPKHLASSFGILIGFQGLGTLFGPPLSGALKDFFDSYDEAFYLGAGLLVVSGLLMIVSNVLNKSPVQSDLSFNISPSNEPDI